MPAPTPQKPKRDMNWGRFSKTFAFWILILLIPVALIQLSSQRDNQAPKINYTQYREQLAANNIRMVTIQDGKDIQGDFRQRVNLGGRASVGKFTTQLPAKDSEKEVEALMARGVVVEAQNARPSITGWI